MKVFTQKRIKELKKAGNIQDIISLWELEKKNNPNIQSIDELEKLNDRQRTGVMNSFAKGVFLGVSPEFAKEVIKYFGLNVVGSYKKEKILKYLKKNEHIDYIKNMLDVTVEEINIVKLSIN